MQGLTVFTIVARRWFDKSAGNTYHSVNVYADGELVGRNPYAYGYGDHYLQTAHEVLQNKGWYPKTDGRLKSGISEDWYNFRNDMVDNPTRFIVECADVARKKDL